MNDCLFCKIIKGEIPSTKIYEDDDFFAFLDITPVNKGHVLLVPKKHSRNILDTQDDVLVKIGPVIKKLSTSVKDGVSADGINIHINNEPVAGQVVFHLHIHIIPRYSNDNLKMWVGKNYNEEKEMEEIANKIKNIM